MHFIRRSRDRVLHKNKLNDIIKTACNKTGVYISVKKNFLRSDEVIA